MPVVIDKTTRADLQEAIREIHLVAGFSGDPTGAPGGRSESFAIGVTSPDYGDGKTTIAIALASSLSEDFGREVTLADADFHTQSIGQQYGLDKLDGIAEVLTGATRLETVRHRRNHAMSIITAGHLPTDPARMARSEELTQLVEKLKATSRYVVFDLPAMLHSMSAPVLAQRCDGVIVVARVGHTTRADLDRTLHLLGNAPVLGIVMNRHTSSIPGWAQRMLALRP
jgi:Mrp family chromosome partitioning ATPase